MPNTKPKGWHSLWSFTEDEQRQLLGTDIGDASPAIVVELDELSMRYFYNERFAPITFHQYVEGGGNRQEYFQVVVQSIDDSSVNMRWEVKKMDIPPHEARAKIDEWLKRTGYFINLKGFESFCHLFGRFEVDYN